MQSDARSLQDKVALITGAGHGIGRATAHRLAEAGAHLVIQDLDDQALRETAKELIGSHGRIVTLAGDLTAEGQPERVISESLNAFGALDILINNAGYIWNGAAHNHSEAQWQAMLEIHVSVPFRLLKAFAGWMRPVAKAEIAETGAAQCRKVVNVSSVSGTTGSATQVGYSAGKAAVLGVTKTLAKEWGRFNVNVNAVAFGHIETRLTQSYQGKAPEIRVGANSFRVGLSESQRSSLAQSVPLGRPGTTTEAAGAIYLLTLPESNYITGEVLTCSGGA